LNVSVSAGNTRRGGERDAGVLPLVALGRPQRIGDHRLERRERAFLRLVAFDDALVSRGEERRRDRRERSLVGAGPPAEERQLFQRDLLVVILQVVQPLGEIDERVDLSPCPSL
jgi:hypothetical protein